MQEFCAASDAVRHLPYRPSDADLLALYALYKQVYVGDTAPAHAPANPFDVRARRKHDAWLALRGVSQYDAARRYVALARALLARNK